MHTLCEAAIVVLSGVLLGWADGDVVSAHSADDAWDPGQGLKPGGSDFRGVQRPVYSLGHEDSGEGGTDLGDDFVAGGDAECEAVEDLAEGHRSGEAAHTDGDALLHGYGSTQRSLLGDGGAELITEHVERGTRHAEGRPELGVRARQTVEAVPPLSAPLPHAQPESAKSYHCFAPGNGLVHGFGSSQGCVLLGDGRAKLMAERTERGARHLESLLELDVRARRAAEVAPPLRAELPHPHPCSRLCVPAAVGRRD